MAGARHGMCELMHGMVGERHGHGMVMARARRAVCESALRRAIGAHDLDLLIAFLHGWRFLIYFVADLLRDIITASCHKSFISHIVIFAFL